MLSTPIQWSGIGIYAASNDRGLYAMAGGATGGAWPAAWKPVAMNGPAQGQPLVLPTGWTGRATDIVLASSQDGHVYCAEAGTGNPCSGWTGGRSSDGFGMLEATPIPLLRAAGYGGTKDLVIVGSRNAASGNSLVAIDLADGSTAWSFAGDPSPGTGGGGDGSIGVVSGSAYVKAGESKVYFASRARAGGSSYTLWALTVGDGAATLLWGRALGDVDGSVTVDNTHDRLLVGTNGGAVYAIDRASPSGATAWSRSFGDGPVKDFVYWSGAQGRLYFSTTHDVWGVPDDGSTGGDWQVPLFSPTRPLLQYGTTRTYVGACADASCADGRLVELDSANAWATPKTYDVPGAGGLGAVIIDRQQTPALAHMGSRSGRVFAVEVPLP